MGDYYAFDYQEIDGEERYGFYMQTEKTGYNGVFVQFTEEQRKQADEWQAKLDALMQEQQELIKSWVD
jgi:hypothetical protein